MPKVFKGEKYIYLLMAYTMAKDNNGLITIGNDNNMVGGQNYYRRFTIQEYEGKTLIEETKTSKSFADFKRVFEIICLDSKTPVIREYFNEDGDNCSNCWTH